MSGSSGSARNKNRTSGDTGRGQRECHINGHLVVDGVEAPLGSFVLEWRLRGYCPYGVAGPLLDGDIDVMVLRDDDLGLQAIVLPARAAVLAQRASIEP